MAREIITDANIDNLLGISESLDQEIPPKISDGIAALLKEYKIKPGLKDALSCKLKEFYPYLLLSDEELQHRYSLEKDGDIGHWKKLGEDIQQIINNTYLCKVLSINIATAEATLGTTFGGQASVAARPLETHHIVMVHTVSVNN